jgi:hypothetical protein
VGTERRHGMSDEAGGARAFHASEITESVGELPGVGGLGAWFEGVAGLSN